MKESNSKKKTINDFNTSDFNINDFFNWQDFLNWQDFSKIFEQAFNGYHFTNNYHYNNNQQNRDRRNQTTINIYQVLGITVNDSIDTIKSKYRKLCLIHHPDKGGDEKKFIEINQAYQELKRQRNF